MRLSKVFDKQKKWETVSAIIILLLMTVTMYYADIIVTSQFSLVFIDSLFDGKFASFYNNALATGIAPEGAVYDLGIYVVFAIWGLPIWILRALFHINEVSVGCMLWFKLLVVVFAYGNLLLLRKIASKLGFAEEICGYIANLGAVSMMFIFPVFVAAQYDIIPLFFMLMGINKWLAKDKRGCLICFSLAFIMKPFALLVYFIVILMDEKKIFRIITTGIISIIPFFICKGIYLLNPSNQASNNIFFANMVNLLLEVSLPFGIGDISLFCFGIIGVYFMAYRYPSQANTVLSGRRLIWFSFLTWAIFCIFTPINPYWIIYLAPFLLLVLFYDMENINTILIFDLFANVGMIVLMIMRFSWVYGGAKTFGYLLLKPLYNVIGHDRVTTVAGMLRQLGAEKFRPALSALLVASFVAIAFFSYKGLREEVGREDISGNVPLIYSWHIRIRIFILYGWVGLCFLLMVLPEIVYG